MNSALRREISNGGFYAHDYSGRPQSLRTTEAGLELSPTTISLIAAVIEGAFTGAPRRSGHGLSYLALSIILVIADLVRMIVTAWGGT